MRKTASLWVGILATLVACCGACVDTGTQRSQLDVTDLLPLPGVRNPHPPSVTLHMDVDFTPQERFAATMAGDIWAVQTSGQARLSFTWDVNTDDHAAMTDHLYLGHNLVFRVTSSSVAAQLQDFAHGCIGCVLGWMTDGGIHNVTHQPVQGAFVMDRIQPDDRIQVFMHEFGHVLGIPHSTSPQAIMYPTVWPGRTPCLRQPDLVGFCTVNECSQKTYSCE